MYERYMHLHKIHNSINSQVLGSLTLVLGSLILAPCNKQSLWVFTICYYWPRNKWRTLLGKDAPSNQVSYIILMVRTSPCCQQLLNHIVTSILRCHYESCHIILWEEEKGQEIMNRGLVSLLRTVSCSWNGTAQSVDKTQQLGFKTKTEIAWKKNHSKNQGRFFVYCSLHQLYVTYSCPYVVNVVLLMCQESKTKVLVTFLHRQKKRTNSSTPWP